MKDVSVVVAPEGDRLAAALVPRLRRLDVPVVECRTPSFCEQPFVLHPEGLHLGPRPVAALVWRLPPGGALAVTGASSVDSDASAAWLAALNLPGLFAVNRYSSSVWYGGGRWSAWQAWLRRQGIPVSRLRLGAPAVREIRWRPFLAGGSRPAPDPGTARALGIATSAAYPASSALLVAGRLMTGSATTAVRAAAATLTARGVVLARLIMDEEDRVLAVDTNPDFRRGDEAMPVVDRLAEAIDERVRAR